MVTRKIRVRKAPTAQKKERRNNGELSAGGHNFVQGHTADLSGAMVVKKNLFGGLFDTKSVIELDIKGENEFPVVEPVFAYRDLLKIYLQSTILRQCVEAYTVNIEGYGHVLEYVGPEGQQKSLAAKNEKRRLERMLRSLTTDGRSLQAHREASRHDKEILGARAFEVAQDMAGRTVMFNQVQAHTLRMTRREKEGIWVNMPDPVTGGTRRVLRRFRRYVQITEEGRRVWFKEYGDPRPIDPATGKINYGLAIEDEATSIYYEALYTLGSPYGTPRWSGAIPALLGAREAEMVNLEFFRDNAIPALAVLVSGGALSAESFDKIEQYIAGVRGRKSMNRIVVLEATADSSDTMSTDGSLPAPKVDIKPMLSERQHEGLFKDYIAHGSEETRSSFRLPPIFIGSAKEYNRASAFASMQTADDQIFIPERASWDFMFDEIVMQTHNPKFWRYKSAAPTLSDPQEVARIVDTLGTEGAITPNIAIKLANRYLDADIQIITDEWGDFPMSIIMAYITAGRTIPGLDIFTDTVDELSQKPAPAKAKEEDALTFSMKEGIYSMVDELSDRLHKNMRKQVQRAVIDYSQHEN